MSGGGPPNVFDPNDVDRFDINDWLDEHDDAPAREELEPDYSPNDPGEWD